MRRWLSTFSEGRSVGTPWDRVAPAAPPTRIAPGMWLIGGREQSIPVEGRVSAAGAARSQEVAMICANPTKFAIHLPADRVRVQFLRSRACSPLDNSLGPRSPSCAQTRIALGMRLIGGREQSIPVEGRVSAAGAARSQEDAVICANPTKFAIHLPADRVRAQFLRSRACSPLDNLPPYALLPTNP